MLATQARDELTSAAVAFLLHERAKEHQAANSPDYEAGLTDVQREALGLEDETFALLWGRRTGKTHVLPRMLLRSAAEPDTWSVYLTKTRKNAKLLLWRWLKKAAIKLGIRYTANETDLVMEVDGGGSILLGGADDLAAIERWRQFGWKLAILDEMGTHSDDLLVVLCDDVIDPATVDYGGDVVYSGTPGYTLGGRWHSLSGPEAKLRVLRADARSNTAVPGIWERCLAIKAKNGWGDDHPTWVREYLGQWCQDASTLVYPIDRERNACTGLPTHTVTGVPLAASGWHYCLGVDVGFVDATAFVLVACHDLDPRDFVVSSEAHGEWLPDQVAAHIRDRYLAAMPWCQVVVDAGGMGKIHAETIRRRYGVPAHAAIKTEKADAIRDLRGRIMSGRVLVLDGAQNDAIRSEWSQLGWDDKREQHHKAQDDHCSDACLYAMRKLHNYRQEPAEPVRALTTAEVAAKLRRQHFKRIEPRDNPWGTGSGL